MSKLLHRSVSARPEIAVSGDGLMLTLASGRKIIDASGGAAVACLGHGNRRVAQAIADQAARLGYAHTGFFSSEPAEALAELLLEGRPGGLARAFFVSSGSEAMEAALKLARQYHLERGEPKRTHFLARRQSYHGNTLGALAASGNVLRRAPYEDILAQNFSRVSPCFPYREQREGESDTAYVERLAQELEAEFQRIGPDRVAAFCAETVVGATAGCVTPTPGYFAAIRKVCDRHGALLILDEVMCGMGRTGTTHAWEQEGVTPDIQTIAKGLAGGYQPIGGILISGKVLGALEGGSRAFVHGQTYQAHPVACAAALEVQRIIRDDNLIANVCRVGAVLETKLKERFAQHPFIGDVRGRGLFWAVEVVADRAEKTPLAPELQVNERVKRHALALGLGVYPMGGTIDGRRGDHVLIAPPYIATTADIEPIVDLLARAIDLALGEVRV